MGFGPTTFSQTKPAHAHAVIHVEWPGHSEKLADERHFCIRIFYSPCSSLRSLCDRLWVNTCLEGVLSLAHTGQPQKYDASYHSASALILLMHTQLLTMLHLINSMVRSYFYYDGSPTARSLV